MPGGGPPMGMPGGGRMPGGPGMLMGGGGPPGGPPIPAGGLYGCGCPAVHETVPGTSAHRHARCDAIAH